MFRLLIGLVLSINLSAFSPNDMLDYSKTPENLCNEMAKGDTAEKQAEACRNAVFYYPELRELRGGAALSITPKACPEGPSKIICEEFKKRYHKTLTDLKVQELTPNQARGYAVRACEWKKDKCEFLYQPVYMSWLVGDNILLLTDKETKEKPLKDKIIDLIVKETGIEKTKIKVDSIAIRTGDKVKHESNTFYGDAYYDFRAQLQLEVAAAAVSSFKINDLVELYLKKDLSRFVPISEVEDIYAIYGSTTGQELINKDIKFDTKLTNNELEINATNKNLYINKNETAKILKLQELRDMVDRRYPTYEGTIEVPLTLKIFKESDDNIAKAVFLDNDIFLSVFSSRKYSSHDNTKNLVKLIDGTYLSYKESTNELRLITKDFNKSFLYKDIKVYCDSFVKFKTFSYPRQLAEGILFGPIAREFEIKSAKPVPTAEALGVFARLCFDDKKAFKGDAAKLTASGYTEYTKAIESREIKKYEELLKFVEATMKDVEKASFDLTKAEGIIQRITKGSDKPNLIAALKLEIYKEEFKALGIENVGEDLHFSHYYGIARKSPLFPDGEYIKQKGSEVEGNKNGFMFKKEGKTTDEDRTYFIKQLQVVRIALLQIIGSEAYNYIQMQAAAKKVSDSITSSCGSGWDTFDNICDKLGGGAGGYIGAGAAVVVGAPFYLAYKAVLEPLIKDPVAMLTLGSSIGMAIWTGLEQARQWNADMQFRRIEMEMKLNQCFGLMYRLEYNGDNINKVLRDDVPVVENAYNPLTGTLQTMSLYELCVANSFMKDQKNPFEDCIKLQYSGFATQKDVVDCYRAKAGLSPLKAPAPNLPNYGAPAKETPPAGGDDKKEEEKKEKEKEAAAAAAPAGGAPAGGSPKSTGSEGNAPDTRNLDYLTGRPPYYGSPSGSYTPSYGSDSRDPGAPTETKGERKPEAIPLGDATSTDAAIELLLQGHRRTTGSGL